tara:strand:+ start:1213 stop:1518 length:306 start_codon:yes stop_codon:yes gene_type:complete
MSQNEDKQNNKSVNVRFTLAESSSASKKFNSKEFKQEVKNTAKNISNCNGCEDDLAKQVADLKEVLAKALEYVDADFEGKIKPYNPAYLGRVINEALKDSE